jgi:hypothetical protein
VAPGDTLREGSNHQHLRAWPVSYKVTDASVLTRIVGMIS